MNIGVYKPFKKVYFLDDKEDTAAWSYEVVNVCKIFSEKGHNITMLSDCDIDKEFNNIKKNEDLSVYYDRILLFSGLFERDKSGNKLIEILRSKCDRLDFILTDLRLLPNLGYFDNKFFDNIYTQATKPLPFIGGKYGGIAELICYDKKFEDLNKVLLNKAKGIKYYFGGTERGRLNDFLEYVYRPECKITGKSDTLKFDTRVDRDEYMNLLNSSRFSIVIADEEYNLNHFITPRHYENILHDIFSFVDHKYDPDGHFISHSDIRRVSSFVELKKKMDYYEDHPLEYIKILEKQRMEIKKEFFNGDYVYNLIGE